MQCSDLLITMRLKSAAACRAPSTPFWMALLSPFPCRAYPSSGCCLPNFCLCHLFGLQSSGHTFQACRGLSCSLLHEIHCSSFLDCNALLTSLLCLQSTIDPVFWPVQQHHGSAAHHICLVHAAVLHLYRGISKGRPQC